MMEKQSGQAGDGAPLLPKWLPRNALLFSITSFFNDVSSEMIFPILPIFVTGVLGAPVWALGLMEGIAHSLETIFRGISGYYSDQQPRRRPLVVAGYGLSALTKPVFAFASSWPFAILIRASDRTGKGIRVTPRDAMLAEDSRGPNMGKIFGIRKMADSAGAVVGPLITFALLAIAASYAVPLPDAYRIIFLLSFFPAALGVLLVFGVREKEKTLEKQPLSKMVKETLFPPPGAWRNFLMISALFSFGNLSYAFFVLAAADAGASAIQVSLLYVLFNLFYMAFAVPAGWLTDKFGSKKMLMGTFLSFVVVCAMFGAAGAHGIPSLEGAILGIPLYLLPFAIGFAFYGIFSAGYETVARIYIAEHFTNKRLGSGLGAYNIMLGFMALPSGMAAGILFPIPGPLGASMAFWLGGACSLAAAIGVFLFYRHSLHVEESGI